MRSPERAMVVITHYQRLLDYIVPDIVHVLVDGRIVRSGGKELAKELSIPVVALAQLNRAPEQRGGRGDQTPRYQLSDLKESGSIEQDADVIMFLHREEQINKDTERKGEADLIIAKQRNGPTGRMVLAFIPKYTKFANMEFVEKERSF
jgi:replicative DNA helicase